mgnify:CR=1 FL=1
MKTILEILSEECKGAFAKRGYAAGQARAVASTRPDLCEYQCNGALAAAKAYKKNPMDIAQEVAEELRENPVFEKVEALKPGFINFNLSNGFLASHLREMAGEERFGIREGKKEKIILDYGGANVAKPLHIGHLRSAVIGESMKRLGAFLGNEVMGDVHLGDWGLQMGLIIAALKEEQPGLVYFQEGYEGEYPTEPPFTLSELERIYPQASKRAKEDGAFREGAQRATFLLQTGHRGYRALWRHIIDLSVADLKKNYGALDVHFELWKGESDAQPYIPGVIQDLKDKGIARVSEGALVVDIAMEGDKKEYPPCIIQKSDGAALYATSDLGTLVEREMLYAPDKYIYVADKRQQLHYTQFFRVAKLAGIVPKERELIYIGFGTMNGKDGTPFKTRDGGVMRLENLIEDVNRSVYERIMLSRAVSSEEAWETARQVGLAAIKYGDLSNQTSKDYIFDIDRFTSFEGNTGPYILYTIVRIKSILAKYRETSSKEVSLQALGEAKSLQQKRLYLEISRFPEVMEGAWESLELHRICQYVYALSNALNSFYHEVKILGETDEEKKQSYLAGILLTKEILESAIHVLGISAPDKM